MGYFRFKCWDMGYLHINFGILSFKSVKSIMLWLWPSYKYLDRVKRIWYLSPMRAAEVQASLRIRAISPEPSLLAHTSSESRGTFTQKARSLSPLNGWACAVKICHDGMLEDTNSLDAAHLFYAQLIFIYLNYGNKNYGNKKAGVPLLPSADFYLQNTPMGRVKRICVFEHSIMTNFNCACPVIQRGQGSGFLSEGSSWLTACMSEQRRFWRDCADAQARLNLRCSHRL